MREVSDPSVPERVSFEEFYLKDYQAVVGLAFALSGSRWLAEDLAQEAFLAAHRNWPRVSAYDQPGAWVRRVVANLSVSAFRRRMVEAKGLVRLALGDRSHGSSDLPSEDAEFWDAVRSLPRRQSQAVALHYLEDLPVSEVATILDMAPGTVKKHLFDGRRELARRLRIEECEA